MASYALDNPAVKPSRRNIIFKRYFNPEDRSEVDQIFRNIVGDSVQNGSARFKDVVVEMEDPDRKCGEYVLAYVPYAFNGTRINICPYLWRLSKAYLEREDFSQPARPACSELGTYVSEQMSFTAAIILHEFLLVTLLQSTFSSH